MHAFVIMNKSSKGKHGHRFWKKLIRYVTLWPVIYYQYSTPRSAAAQWMAIKYTCIYEVGGSVAGKASTIGIEN